MLRRQKIRSLKRVSGLRNNKKPKVYPKRVRALLLRKNKLVTISGGQEVTFLKATFGMLGAPHARSIQNPMPVGNTVTRLPKDEYPNETGNIRFGEYKKGQGDTGWSTGRYHPSNPEGTVGSHYGWNIGNWGNTPSSQTGPETGGIAHFLPDDVTQNAVAGYAYTEASGGYHLIYGRMHTLRTPRIDIDHTLYKDCVLEFKSLFFQRNTININWEIKLQFCTQKNFNSGDIYDMTVTWGANDPQNSIVTHKMNAKAHSMGGHNTIFDSSSNKWAGDWTTCKVSLPKKTTMYDQSNVPTLVDMDVPYYIRFASVTRYHAQDWAIDSIRIYGYTR